MTRFPMLRCLRPAPTILALILLGSLAFGSGATAQPSGARGDDFIYRVLKNDTLINLSNRYTGTPGNWQTLQSLNAINDPYALPIGRELRIPFALIPEVDAQAEVIHVSGDARLNQRPVRPHDTIHEGDVLQTPAGSYVTFRLPDSSTASVPASSTISIERLRTFLGTGLIDTILKLDQGDLESSVAPQNQGVGRYEVQTPVSITGVRGTRLRVRADSQGARTEVLSGAAQLGATSTDGPKLGAQQGTAVTPDGTILNARPLLPAPTLRPDEAQLRSRTLMFEPVPGAVAYLTRVARDEAGTQPVWTQTITEPPVHYRTPGGGTWHVLVRAIDDVGLMSDDASYPVDGRPVLVSSTGGAVYTHYGEPVMLSDY